MQLINSYATKIQKQWRMYWFRKCLKFIILKLKQNQHYSVLNQFYSQHNPNIKSNTNSHINKSNQNTKIININSNNKPNSSNFNYKSDNIYLNGKIT